MCRGIRRVGSTLISGSIAIGDSLGMGKWFQPRLCGKIKVNILLNKNPVNLGIVGNLVHNVNISKGKLK